MTASRWSTTGSVEFVQHKGLGAMEVRDGEAVLNDLVFDNGTIEFDIETTGRLGGGIGFRRRDKDTYENFYLRPGPNARQRRIAYNMHRKRTACCFGTCFRNTKPRPP